MTKTINDYFKYTFFYKFIHLIVNFEKKLEFFLSKSRKYAPKKHVINWQQYRFNLNMN